MSATETTERIESVRPPEILCQIFQLAIESDGIKPLLPFTHVCTRWRRAALGDTSLWTIIYLSQINAPVFDMVLERAGSRLFTVFIDHHDLCRAMKIWGLVHRIEELHYSSLLHILPVFLNALGPAPHLKVLHLRPELTAEVGVPRLAINLPVIFSDHLPSLRDLVLTRMVAWPLNLFRDLLSFECGDLDNFPISPIHVLEVLRACPTIEVLRLVGHCKLPEFDSPVVTLSSLKRCTLIGHGTTALIRFITVPASASVFLRRPNPFDRSNLPSFDDLSVASGLYVLDEVSALSFSIHDHAVRLQSKNVHGGVLDVEERGLDDVSNDPPIFVYCLQSIFYCGCACPGFKFLKEFTLHIERGGTWDDPKAMTLCSILFVEFIFDHPSIEQVTLHGLPLMEFVTIFGFLSSSTSHDTYSSPNLKRLCIETTPLFSPKVLLEELDRLLGERKNLGVPLESLKVKVKCELLIPAAEHCAYLSAWEDLVGGVRLEYEHAKIEVLPTCHRHDYEEKDEDKGRDKSGGGDGIKDEVDARLFVFMGDPSAGPFVGWDGWPGQYPKTVGEMRGQ